MSNLSDLYQVEFRPRSPSLFITGPVAAHLGEELRRGRWKGEMPGRNQLVKELGVSGRTVELALQQLDKRACLIWIWMWSESAGWWKPAKRTPGW